MTVSNDELYGLLALSLSWIVIVTWSAPHLLTLGTWWYRQPNLSLALWWTLLVSSAGAFVVAVLSVAGLLVLVHDDSHSGVHRIGTEMGMALLVIALVAGLSYAVGRTERMFGRTSAVHAKLDILIATMGSRREQRIGYELITLHTDQPLALAVPGKSPRIVLSDGLVQQLTTAQINAIIWHERAHLELRHDSLIRLASLMEVLLGRIRASRALSRSVHLLTELAADDYACQRAGAEHVRSAMEALRVAEGNGSLHVRTLRLPGL